MSSLEQNRSEKPLSSLEQNRSEKLQLFADHPTILGFLASDKSTAQVAEKISEEASKVLAKKQAT